MADKHFDNLRIGFLGRLALALMAGVFVFISVSFLTNGLFPFFEFVIAGAVVYFIMRR